MSIVPPGGGAVNSNNTYSQADQKYAEAHDRHDSLPDTLDEAKEPLRAYVARHHLALDDLVRVGARLAKHGTTLAYFHGPERGIRYLDLIAGRPWSSYGFDADAAKIIPGPEDRRNGDGTHRIVVCEGESDAARMSGKDGPGFDVLVMLGGAQYVPQSYADALADYDQIFVATDADKAGDQAHEKLRAALPDKAVTRWRPPIEGADWSDLDEIGAPPAPVAVAPTRSLWTAFDFDALPTPPDWILGGLLERGTVTVLSGDTGTAKSWFGLTLIAATAHGTGMLGRDNLAARVMVVDEENPHAVPYARLRALGVTNANGRCFKYANREGVNIGTDKWTAWLRAEVEVWRPDVLVVDGLMSATTFTKPEDNEQAVKVMKLLRQIAKDYELAGLVYHHERKNTAEGGRGNPSHAVMGARQIINQSDFGMGLAFKDRTTTPEGDGLRLRTEVRMEVTKPHRNAVPPAPERWAVESTYDDAGVLTWTSGLAFAGADRTTAPKFERQALALARHYHAHPGEELHIGDAAEAAGIEHGGQRNKARAHALEQEWLVEGSKRGHYLASSNPLPEGGVDAPSID